MKKFAIATIIGFGFITNAYAMDVKINNHTDDYITSFSIDRSFHDISIPPHSSGFTGAYSERCGAHELEAWGENGGHWHSYMNLCGDGVLNWNLT